MSDRHNGLDKNSTQQMYRGSAGQADILYGAHCSCKRGSIRFENLYTGLPLLKLLRRLQEAHTRSATKDTVYIYQARLTICLRASRALRMNFRVRTVTLDDMIAARSLPLTKKLLD